jgi:hypothetical protein
MSPHQLRTALRELNGSRHLTVAFAGVYSVTTGPVAISNLIVRNAMLIPDEADHLVKVTDGKSIFILDAERVAWLEIGLP